MTLPRDLAVSRGSRDDASIVPYMGCGNAGFAVGRRVSQAHNVRPYMGCGGAGFAVGCGVAPVRRGGIHPARRRLRRRGVRRDEGIPPYGRPESDSRSFSPRARPGRPKT